MITIDFEKAFDSVNWNFLCRVLKTFNFGPSLLSWVQTFYKNISSCVLNNGEATPFFQIERGARQGDPLSPYLFILCLEPLLIQIRNEDNIKGLTIKDEKVKLVTFADDLTVFVKCVSSYNKLIEAINRFSSIAGLKMNRDKTEVLYLGHANFTNEELQVKEIKKAIKILGIFFTYDYSLLKKLNVHSMILKIKDLLNVWKMRGLTLFGKIQIIKTFIIPKILFCFYVISADKNTIKEINKILYEFVWNGKDRIKRRAFISDFESGGLKMPDIESFILSQRIMCIKKYSDTSSHSTWKPFWIFILKMFVVAFCLNVTMI